MDQSMKKNISNESSVQYEESYFLDRKRYHSPEIKVLGRVNKITLNGPGECPDSGATWDFPFGDCNQTS